MANEDQSKRSSKEIINEFVEGLETHNIAEGLQVGEKAPDFALEDKEGNILKLSDLIQDKIVVVSFYRGDWCRHCIRELNDLNDHYEQFKEMGVEILGISPQTTSIAASFTEKHNFKFPLLADINFETIKSYKLDFLMSEAMQELYTNSFNLNLPDLTANGSWELPNPATYVVDRNQLIVYKFADRKYWNRLAASKLLEDLKSLISKL